MNRSFSLRCFNEYETEINEHFWSFKVISDYARFIAKAEKAKNPKTVTALVFKATGPDARRIPPTVSEWLDAREELENWLRLSALVSAASYLEAYLRQIIRSALMSDPLCSYGAPKVLDGTILLKSGKELSYTHQIQLITEGDWNSRFAAFKKLFGGLPENTISKLATLEKIRKIRNDFAHGFGRDLNPPRPSNADILPAQRLNQKNFVNYIEALSKSAASIDKYLLDGFIGNFELIDFYHEWRAKDRDPRDAGYTNARALQRAFNRDASVTVNTEFCEELMAYYDRI